MPHRRGHRAAPARTTRTTRRGVQTTRRGVQRVTDSVASRGDQKPVINRTATGTTVSFNGPGGGSVRNTTNRTGMSAMRPRPVGHPGGRHTHSGGHQVVHDFEPGVQPHHHTINQSTNHSSTGPGGHTHDTNLVLGHRHRYDTYNNMPHSHTDGNTGQHVSGYTWNDSVGNPSHYNPGNYTSHAHGNPGMGNNNSSGQDNYPIGPNGSHTHGGGNQLMSGNNGGGQSNIRRPRTTATRTTRTTRRRNRRTY